MFAVVIFVAALRPGRSDVVASDAARARAGAPPPLPGVERVVSEMVLIEVHATDTRGVPVTDLTRDDFILRIDRDPTPVAIASFDQVGWERSSPVPSTRTVGGGAPRPDSALSSIDASSSAASPAVKPAIPSRTILLFDDAVSLPWHMSAARAAAKKLLARLSMSGHEFALVAHEDRRGLRILHDFTSDGDALVRALDASLHDPKRISAIESMEFRRGAMTQDEVLQERRTMAMEDAHHLSQVLQVVRALVTGLAPWPGQKAIVFMGDGIPMNPADVYGLDEPLLSLQTDLNGLINDATAANVTLDAIQTTGLAAGPEERAASLGAVGLATLALNTGGVRVTSNDLGGALTRVETARAKYYVLGYAPPGPPDGRGHLITVEVRRPGVTLRYRRAFTRFPAEEGRERLLRAAFTAPELHPDLDLDAVALPEPAPDGEQVVDLVLFIPAGRILFVPRPGGAAASLEIGILGVDENRRETLHVSRRLDASLTPVPPLRAGPTALDIVTRLRLPAVRHDLTLVVSDLGTGVVGATRLHLEPSPPGPAGASAERGLALYSRDEMSLWIGLGAEGGENAPIAASSRFAPALRSRFAPGERVAWAFRTPARAADPPASLRLTLVRDTTVIRTFSLDAAEASTAPGDGGRDPAPLSLDGLAAGEYTLDADLDVVALGRFRFRIQPKE